MMNWYTTFVFYLGIVDASAVMVGGLIMATIFLFGLDAEKFWERVLPAVFTLIGANVAAAAILGATKWLIGG